MGLEENMVKILLVFLNFWIGSPCDRGRKIPFFVPCARVAAKKGTDVDGKMWLKMDNRRNDAPLWSLRWSGGDTLWCGVEIDFFRIEHAEQGVWMQISGASRLQETRRRSSGVRTRRQKEKEPRRRTESQVIEMRKRGSAKEKEKESALDRLASRREEKPRRKYWCRPVTGCCTAYIHLHTKTKPPPEWN